MTYCFRIRDGGRLFSKTADEHGINKMYHVVGEQKQNIVLDNVSRTLYHTRGEQRDSEKLFTADTKKKHVAHYTFVTCAVTRPRRNFVENKNNIILPIYFGGRFYFFFFGSMNYYQYLLYHTKISDVLCARDDATPRSDPIADRFRTSRVSVE